MTEAKKIAAMAEAYSLPVAPHDCTGPVNFAASVHLDFAVTNVYVQEIVRAYLHGWYGEVVSGLPRVEGGYVYPPEGTGLGVRLLDSVRSRDDATVRISKV